jgi:hypothetical protein
MTRATPLSRLAVSCVFAVLLAGCASTKDASAREWDRAECNRIIDREDRERCLKRL